MGKRVNNRRGPKYPGRGGAPADPLYRRPLASPWARNTKAGTKDGKGKKKAARKIGTLAIKKKPGIIRALTINRKVNP